MCIWFRLGSIRITIRRKFCTNTPITWGGSGRWDFLTGPKSAIYGLSKGGFKLAVSDGAVNWVFRFIAPEMALVDRHGEIRGYYDVFSRRHD